MQRGADRVEENFVGGQIGDKHFGQWEDTQSCAQNSELVVHYYAI